MNLDDFLKLGKELIQGNKISEVKIRTSMGRGYNYVFHYVRENCRKHPDSKFSDGKGDHQETVRFLERIEERRLASTLNYLTDKRNSVEYDLRLKYNLQDALDYIDDVEDFVKKFNSENIKNRRVKKKKVRMK